MLVGALLPLIAIVAWAVMRDGTPPASSTPSSTVVAAPPASVPPGTTVEEPGASEPASPPATLLEPIVSGDTVSLVTLDGTLTFEVVGHEEETVQVLPEVRDEQGHYYRIDFGREGGWVIEESGDGVEWHTMPSIPDGVHNPGLIGADDGVVLVSYGYPDEPTQGAPWESWRWRNGEWLLLEGVPSTTGLTSTSLTTLASGEELLVTDAGGPFSGLAWGDYGCPAVQGVRSTEFGLSVNLVDSCAQEAPMGTLSLLGSGSSAVAVLVHPLGKVIWRSPPGAEPLFEQLVAYALSEDPEKVSDAGHILSVGGEQRFWTSVDGIEFHLVSAVPFTPFPGGVAVVEGEVIVVQPDVSLSLTGREWHIGEPSSVRVLASTDARTWVDIGLEVDLPIGEPLGQMSVVATPSRALVRVMDESFVRVEGEWAELEGIGNWDWIQSLGNHFLGVDWGQNTRLAVSGDGVTWEAFDPTAVIDALDCGTDFTNWQAVGDELWFSGWDGRGVCIIRGRFEETP